MPPIVVIMAFHPAFEQYDMSTLELLLSGAAPLREGPIKKVLARLAKMGNTRVRLAQGYVQSTLFSPEVSLASIEHYLRARL